MGLYSWSIHYFSSTSFLFKWAAIDVHCCAISFDFFGIFDSFRSVMNPSRFKTLIFLDLETTGLIIDQPKITELAMIAVHVWVFIESCQWESFFSNRFCSAKHYCRWNHTKKCRARWSGEYRIEENRSWNFVLSFCRINSWKFSIHLNRWTM